MAWKAFGSAFGLTFIAEFGDKTQIAILTLAARYGWLPVFLGAVGAFAILNAVAVTAGAVIASLVPEAFIRYGAAAVFIVFGLLSFIPEKEKEEEEGESKSRGPFLTSLVVVALMELGDKTQLSLVALTSKYRYPFLIFLGGTVALTVTSFIGAIVGKGLSEVIPFKWIRWLSGAVFVAFGILTALNVF